MGSYFSVPRERLLPRTALLVSNISEIDHVLVESEVDALLLEANLIRKFAPKFNVDWKDGKAYPLIEITTKEQIPLVRRVRHERDPQATYFGPFPTGSNLTYLLRVLRRIFPYLSESHRGEKICIRAHLGLCPCREVYQSREGVMNYQKTIRRLLAFLGGKRKRVEAGLEREMKQKATDKDFETAAVIRDQLAGIARLTEKVTSPWDYEVNPNLVSDRNQTALLELGRLLGIEKLSKIEGYDVSNWAGKSATAAQVVFIDGEPEKSLYRRYKIRFQNKPDDLAMIGEVLRRRLKSTVPLPDLLVIDGGKWQTNKASNTIKIIKSIRIKVIGLAKRLETIYTDDGRKIQLSPGSAALQLLQRVRDEAHRFSRKYHFWLRRKKMLT